MYEKPCRCGKSKKNFKMDIGPFFVDECCIEAGYDELGNRAQKELDESTKSILEEVQKSSYNQDLEIQDNPEYDIEVTFEGGIPEGTDIEELELLAEDSFLNKKPMPMDLKQVEVKKKKNKNK